MSLKSVHTFRGLWITTEEFEYLEPRHVFHRQLDTSVNLPEEHLNKHIIFRKKFEIENDFRDAKIYISGDDYYKLYINGNFVSQGPAPAYPFAYTYNVVDLAPFLKKGKNLIAIHTYYQGLINRVWVSGDNRHGLLCDLEIDGKIVLSSDESFRVKEHSGYREIGRVGYDTQFLEEYDSNAKECSFMELDFDDSFWEQARVRKVVDYKLVHQPTKSLVFEEIQPKMIKTEKNRMIIDFGKCYVGYLNVTARGGKNDVVTIRCGQELWEDGSVRYQMRCNCNFEEKWILSGNTDALNWFDYTAFRYAELVLPEGCSVEKVSLTARHYPFELLAEMKESYRNIPELQKIWDLCVHSIGYGVQEVIQDCMEREKGFYVGDGCYTALCHFLMTGDDSIVRYLIDSAYLSSTFVESTVTCLNCSFMQEIAEFPLMLVSLMLWHYRLTEEEEYLRQNYEFACRLAGIYYRDYEKDGLLQDLDKWCVVEWPKNFRDGYDVNLKQGQVCETPHIVINAHYIEMISNINKMAEILGYEPYRDLSELKRCFLEAFYDDKRHVFKDSVETEHSSYVSNVFAFGFGLLPDEECKKNILQMIRNRGISEVSLFAAFPMLEGMIRNGQEEEVKNLLLDEGAWLRMLREDATATFEGWGKECKINTSLFHLTMSYAAIFLTDIDHKRLFQ